jgi:hypothetical protein
MKLEGRETGMGCKKLVNAQRVMASTGVLVLALILIGAWHGWPEPLEVRPEAQFHAGDSTHAVDSTAVALADPANEVAGNRPDIGLPQEADVSTLPVDAYRSLNAAQAFAHAVSLPVGHPDRDRVLASLTTLCKRNRQVGVDADYQDWVELRMVGNSDEAKRAHARWFARMDAYCRGFDWSVAHAQRTADMSAALPVLEFGPVADSRWLTEITNAAQKADYLKESSVLEDIWQIALTSDSPALVEHALDLLAGTESGTFGEFVGLFPIGHRSGGTDQDRQIATRRAAGLVYSCRVFLHCSAGMLRSVVEIPHTELAGQLGVEGVLREDLSPQQWRAVELMVERLQSSRSRIEVEQAPGG